EPTATLIVTQFNFQNLLEVFNTFNATVNTRYPNPAELEKVRNAASTDEYLDTLLKPIDLSATATMKREPGSTLPNVNLMNSLITRMRQTVDQLRAPGPDQPVAASIPSGPAVRATSILPPRIAPDEVDAGAAASGIGEAPPPTGPFIPATTRDIVQLGVEFREIRDNVEASTRPGTVDLSPAEKLVSPAFKARIQQAVDTLIQNLQNSGVDTDSERFNAVRQSVDSLMGETRPSAVAMESTSIILNTLTEFIDTRYTMDGTAGTDTVQIEIGGYRSIPGAPPNEAATLLPAGANHMDGMLYQVLYSGVDQVHAVSDGADTPVFVEMTTKDLISVAVQFRQVRDRHKIGDDSTMHTLTTDTHKTNKERAVKTLQNRVDSMGDQTPQIVAAKMQDIQDQLAYC
ncbi:hypothetical protein EBR96_05110, partial [bacterium]|nr:hypothetical protein [bacterium]